MFVFVFLCFFLGGGGGLSLICFAHCHDLKITFECFFINSNLFKGSLSEGHKGHL